MRGFYVRLFGLFQLVIGVVIAGGTFMLFGVLPSLDKPLMMLAFFVMAPLYVMGMLVAVFGMVECVQGEPLGSAHEKLEHVGFAALAGLGIAALGIFMFSVLPPIDPSVYPDSIGSFIDW